MLQVAEAREVCRACRVNQPCLQWSFDSGVDHGIWGALTEEERRSLKRRQSPIRIKRSV
jgi:WhiB family redox-sensing transcriptional regulator